MKGAICKTQCRHVQGSGIVQNSLVSWLLPLSSDVLIHNPRDVEGLSTNQGKGIHKIFKLEDSICVADVLTVHLLDIFDVTKPHVVTLGFLNRAVVRKCKPHTTKRFLNLLEQLLTRHSSGFNLSPDLFMRPIQFSRKFHLTFFTKESINVALDNSFLDLSARFERGELGKAGFGDGVRQLYPKLSQIRS